MRMLSLATSMNYDIPLETQLSLLAQTGLTHVSFGAQPTHSGIGEEAQWPRLKAMLAAHGLRADTLHGIALDKAGALAANEVLARAARFLEIPVIVVHASAFAFRPDTLNDRKAQLRALLPALRDIAAANGIVWAVENVLPGVATDLAEWFVREADTPCIGFCYDSAHDQIEGPRPMALLSRWCDALYAVHLSDRSADFTDHQLPGEGFIDFDAITALLRAASFDRPLLLEVMTTHSAHGEPPEAFIQAAYARGCKLYDAIHTR